MAQDQSGEKVLFLMRHATAEHFGIGGDRMRSLTTSGREEASRVGRDLANAAIEKVLVSSAARTRQTASQLGLGVDTVSLDDLYNGGSWTILEWVQGLADDVKVALVVGHSPGIPSLVHDLADETSDHEAMAQISTHFPTGTCCELRFQGSWSGLEQACLVRTILAHPPR